jgi:hypothetical protein
MSSEFGTSNPYVSPNFAGYAQPIEREKAPGSLLAAAIALIGVAALGLAISTFNFARSFGAAHVDPNAPEFVRQVQQGAVGPVATAIQGTCVLVNLFIIVCGVQMMKLQNWGMAVAGSILAMVNVGSCCCVLGIPVGICSLMVLMSPNTISIFSAVKAQ